MAAHGGCTWHIYVLTFLGSNWTIPLEQLRFSLLTILTNVLPDPLLSVGSVFWLPSCIVNERGVRFIYDQTQTWTKVIFKNNLPFNELKKKTCQVWCQLLMILVLRRQKQEDHELGYKIWPSSKNNQTVTILSFYGIFYS